MEAGMASLYKKPVILNNSRTDKPVKTKSRKWLGRFKDEHGEPSDSPHFRSRLAPMIGANTAFHLGGRLQKMYWICIGPRSDVKDLPC